MEKELNPMLKELWDDYKKVVKESGYGKESIDILVKIYSFTPKE